MFYCEECAEIHETNTYGQCDKCCEAKENYDED